MFFQTKNNILIWKQKSCRKAGMNLLWCDPAELFGEIWTEAGSLGRVDFAGIRPLSDGLVEPADWLWNNTDMNWIDRDCGCSWPLMNLSLFSKDSLPLDCVDFATQWRLLPQSPCPSLWSHEGEELSRPWDTLNLKTIKIFSNYCQRSAAECRVDPSVFHARLNTKLDIRFNLQSTCSYVLQ